MDYLYSNKYITIGKVTMIICKQQEVLTAYCRTALHTKINENALDWHRKHYENFLAARGICHKLVFIDFIHVDVWDCMKQEDRQEMTDF